MSNPKSPARKLLEVKVMFEPTRLAAAHLADAYAQVVPLRRRSTKTTVVSAPVAPGERNIASLKPGGRS